MITAPIPLDVSSFSRFGNLATEVRDAVRTYALTFWLRSSISMSMASFSVVSLIAMVPDNE
jgi:hypothetical protein